MAASYKERLITSKLRKREIYMIRKEEKMCITCGEPIEQFVRCHKCRIKRSEQAKKYRKNHKLGESINNNTSTFTIPPPFPSVVSCI